MGRNAETLPPVPSTQETAPLKGSADDKVIFGSKSGFIFESEKPSLFFSELPSFELSNEHVTESEGGGGGGAETRPSFFTGEAP